MDIFSIIGYNAVFIALLINIIALYDQKKYLGVYLVFFAVTYQVVVTLKQMIKQPRPNGYLTMDDGGEYVKNELYGMPSGHSAFIFYSTTFLWLVKQNIPLLLIELFLCAITVYQRFIYKKHTVEQLVVGAVLGASIAAACYQIARQYYKGRVM